VHTHLSMELARTWHVEVQDHAASHSSYKNEIRLTWLIAMISLLRMMSAQLALRLRTYSVQYWCIRKPKD
jgi:hypothetical protein